MLPRFLTSSSTNSSCSRESRLDDVVAALGYAAPQEENGRPDRRTVLDRLAAKEISVEDAMKLLRS